LQVTLKELAATKCYKLLVCGVLQCF
jgi:hypothetical protein